MCRRVSLLRYFFRFSINICLLPSYISGDKADACCEMITLSKSHKGESFGRGSVSVASIAAPAKCFDSIATDKSCSLIIHPQDIITT